MNILSQRLTFLVISCLLVAVTLNNVPTTSIDLLETDLETMETHIMKESYIVENPIDAEEFVEEPLYTDNELWLLAHLIWGEAGSDWISDLAQQYVASVALNRVEDPDYPDTLYEVIYQPGQYTCIYGCFYGEPTQRCWDNARYVLENGAQMPGDVVYQSSVMQGSGLFCEIDGILFCYK